MITERDKPNTEYQGGKFMAQQMVNSSQHNGSAKPSTPSAAAAGA